MTGEVPPPRRRVTFWPPKKSPKKRQGVGPIGFGSASSSMCPTPWTPHFTGAANAEVLAVNAKARVVQLTGFRSISAAAEGRVTFGRCFSWWGARLLDWWSSILAQWDGGRVLDPPLRSARKGVCLCIGAGPRPAAGGLWPLTSSVTLRVTPSPKGEGRGMGLPKPSPLGEGAPEGGG